MDPKDPFEGLPTNELAEMVKTLCQKWFAATGKPWPPKPGVFYYFPEFSAWLKETYPEDAVAVDDPKYREIVEIYFQVFTLQSWMQDYPNRPNRESED